MSTPVDQPETPAIVPMTRDDVLSANDIVIEGVVVPEWGGRTVYVRSLSAGERDDFETDVMKEKRVRTKAGRIRTEKYVETRRVRAKLAVKACCISKDNPAALFKPADVEKLATKNGAALDRIYDLASRLAGITDDDVEELIKKSPGTNEVDVT